MDSKICSLIQKMFIDLKKFHNFKKCSHLKQMFTKFHDFQKDLKNVFGFRKLEGKKQEL